jgi:hypothetical protein
MHYRGYTHPHRCQHCAELVFINPKLKNTNGYESILEHQQQSRKAAALYFAASEPAAKNLAKNLEAELQSYIVLDSSKENFELYASDGCAFYAIVTAGLTGSNLSGFKRRIAFPTLHTPPCPTVGVESKISELPDTTFY